MLYEYYRNYAVRSGRIAIIELGMMLVWVIVAAVYARAWNAGFLFRSVSYFVAFIPIVPFTWIVQLQSPPLLAGGIAEMLSLLQPVLGWMLPVLALLLYALKCMNEKPALSTWMLVASAMFIAALGFILPQYIYLLRYIAGGLLFIVSANAWEKLMKQVRNRAIRVNPCEDTATRAKGWKNLLCFLGVNLPFILCYIRGVYLLSIRAFYQI